MQEVILDIQQVVYGQDYLTDEEKKVVELGQ